jgi:D-psicose/D-tagatose/L-ribulose 3-epimerase
MKIAISNIAWESFENDRVAELLSARSVEGVEIAPTKIWPKLNAVDDKSIAYYRNWWERRGIRIVALQSLLFGRPDLNIFGGAEVRRSMLDYLCHAIRIASLLGARVLVFGSPKNRQAGELDAAAAIEVAAEFFYSLAVLGQDSGVYIGLEPNPAAYGCDFIRTSAEALNLVKLVAHPAFRVHLDAAILDMTGENFEEAVGNCADFLVHVHVSEPMLGVVGEGETDHARMAHALHSARYQGWVSIEMRSGWREDNTVSVARALDFTLQTYSRKVNVGSPVFYGN